MPFGDFFLAASTRFFLDVIGTTPTLIRCVGIAWLIIGVFSGRILMAIVESAVVD